MSTQCLTLFSRSPTLHVESPLQKGESRLKLKLRSVDTQVDTEIDFSFSFLLTSHFLPRLSPSRRSALCIVSRWNFDGFALKIGYPL